MEDLNKFYADNIDHVRFDSLPMHWRFIVIKYEKENPDYEYNGIQWTYKDEIWTARIHYKHRQKKVV